MSEDGGRFAYIPEWVIRAIGKDGSAMLVYCHLALFRSNDHQYVYPSVPTIAKELGMTDRSVQRSIKSLENANVLKIMPMTGTSNRYLIPISREDCSQYGGGDRNVTRGVSDLSPGGCQICHPINTNETIQVKNNINTRARVSQHPSTLEEVGEYAASLGYTSFDSKRFWSYYNQPDRDAWTFKDGTRVKDWKACVRTWCQKLTKPDPEPEEKPDPITDRGSVIADLLSKRVIVEHEDWCLDG